MSWIAPTRILIHVHNHDDVVLDQRLTMVYVELWTSNIWPNITYRRTLSACVLVEEYNYDDLGFGYRALTVENMEILMVML